MSIRITCRECDASYTISDEMAGRKVRCKECDADVRVPDEVDDDRPSRRRSRKRDAGGMSTTTLVLLIVGGVLGVGCIICTGVAGVIFLGAREAVNAVDELNRGMNARAVPPGHGKIIFSQQGVLMANDPFREGRPTKTFQVNMQQGKTYVIDLVSMEMDSYLFLFDPGNFKVAEDDDGGGFPNSRIRFTANRTGNHTIGCASFDGPQGGGSRFTVTVREE